MSEWKETTLGEISLKITDGAHHSPKEFDCGKPMFSVKNMRDQGFDYNGVKTISDEDFVKLVNSGCQPQKDDILIAKDGSVMKHVFRVKGAIDYVLLSSIAIVRPDKSKVNPSYLVYAIKDPSTTDLILNNFVGGSGVPRIVLKDFKKVDLTIPSLDTQKSIASILSSLDDKIDLLHRQNVTLEKMAETLFRQWFVEEAKEEWDEINFGEFVTPKKGKNITKSEVVEGSYPVVAGGLEPSCYHIEANTKSPVITISASGANAGYIRLYTTPVWSSDSSYIDESITPYVYFCYVFLKINQSKLTDKQEGSAQPHIYPSHIMELDFMSYPESIIKVFEESARPLFNKIKSNQTQIRTLTALRDTLLPKLMSGEVRVEPD